MTTPGYFQRTILTLAGIGFGLSLTACGQNQKRPEENMVAQAKAEAEQKKDKRGLEPVEMPIVNDMKIKLRDAKDQGTGDGGGEAGSGSSWSYVGAMGPDNWAAMNPQYAACSEGQNQSPINLLWRRPSKTQNIQFAYRQEPLKVENTGHFIQLSFDPGQSATFEGLQFPLKNVRFHSPSEHKFSGKEFPAELAFVHQNDKGQKVIVSVMIIEGKANAALTQILPHIPSQKNEGKMVQQQPVHPASLLPVNYNHYRYFGSESIPPCTEGVARVVLNTPIEASSEQIAQLRSFYFGNRRPLQPIEEQDVQLFFGQ